MICNPHRFLPGLLWILAGAANAADDFDKLLAQALATHPAVEGRRASLEAARADREGTEWQQYPTPSFEGLQRDSGGNSGIFALEQPLWTGGRITAGIRAAGFREAAAVSAVVEAKLTTALRVIATYTEVLRQKDRQGYAKASVDEHDKLLALINRRVRQEVSPPSDRVLRRRACRRRPPICRCRFRARRSPRRSSPSWSAGRCRTWKMSVWMAASFPKHWTMPC